jgi:hypothetical protein
MPKLAVLPPNRDTEQITLLSFQYKDRLNELKNVTDRTQKTFETCMSWGKITQQLTPQSLCGVVTSRGACHTQLEKTLPFEDDSSSSHNPSMLFFMVSLVLYQKHPVLFLKIFPGPTTKGSSI